ncbi:VOC family protein [Kitasatospora sp. NPDC006697]|uniref:VOC family protein n=1 Tax=Kitasatospora sp. NPDC006697 TaxID=3364020 RepID=UPI00368CEF99
MPVLHQFATVVLECADPVALAAFYQKATGWELAGSEPDFTSLSAGPGTPGLAFARVADAPAPDWPGGGARLHLDFTVPDLDAAVRELLSLSASRPDFQPGGTEWTVLTDPQGHPFCLIAG